MLEESGIEVNGDEVTVDNYTFTIDREELKIVTENGESNIKVTKEVKSYKGKNTNGKYEAEILVIIESDKELQSIEIRNPDGTTFAIETNKTKIEKDIIVEFDEEYKVIITTKEGKTSTRNIIEKSQETIRTAEELVEFRDKVNKGLTYEGKTINLLNDIDLRGNESNRNWKSIGNSIENQYFSGIFEGNNHKIFNIYNMDTTAKMQGLFSVINGGTVQNLGLESGSIKGKDRTALHDCGMACFNEELME